MDSKAILARNLRLLRANKGVSQEALADAAGIDRSYMSDLEREKSSPTLDMVDALALALGVPAYDLIRPGADFAHPHG